MWEAQSEVEENANPVGRYMYIHILCLEHAECAIAVPIGPKGYDLEFDLPGGAKKRPSRTEHAKALKSSKEYSEAQLHGNCERACARKDAVHLLRVVFTTLFLRLPLVVRA